MLVSGDIENVPVLDVFQVVSFSKQTGVLTIEGASASGTLIFEDGGIVCGISTSTSALLARTASETDRRTQQRLRRLLALAVLTELLSQQKGSFRFQGAKSPVAELAGVSLRVFYEAGLLDTGELLLLVATAIDKPQTVPVEAAANNVPRQEERSHPRYSPTLIPASFALGASSYEGHLTNLSRGGACFHGETFPPAESVGELRFMLPGALGSVEARARVAWVRADPKNGRKGAGLEFAEIEDEARGRLDSYLDRYQSLAEDYLEPKRENVRG